MNRVRKTIKVVFALLVFTATQAWAAGGYIFDASGDVSLSVLDGTAKPANKNDPVAQNMVVTTGNKSHAVLKFDDGQLVTLQEKSTFQVREYRYEEKQPEQNSIVFSLLKGGMRFVTGLIGQQNKKAFKLVTPSATIGIRGTDAMAVILNNSLYTQVSTGGIGVSNAAGTAIFTAGQTAVTLSSAALPSAISSASLPAGTFGQLGSIALPGAGAGAGAGAGTGTGAGAGAGAQATGAAASGTAGSTAVGGAVAGSGAATVSGAVVATGLSAGEIVEVVLI